MSKLLLGIRLSVVRVFLTNPVVGGDVFYPSPFSLTLLIDGSNPGYIILFCTTSQVYSLKCMHNGLTHHTVSEEEKEDPRRGRSPHTSGSPPRNIPLRICRGQLTLAKHSHPIELPRLLRKNAQNKPRLRI